MQSEVVYKIGDRVILVQLPNNGHFELGWEGVVTYITEGNNPMLDVKFDNGKTAKLIYNYRVTPATKLHKALL